MKKLITLLLILPFLIACSSDDPISNPNENLGGGNYSKMDSVFNYRFGSSIEDIKPDVIRSKNIAFSYSNGSTSGTATVFHFENTLLTAVCKYYSANTRWFNTHNFENDINSLNPPVKIELTNYVLYPEDYEDWMNTDVIYLKKDSIKWSYNHLNILIYNDYFSFDKQNPDSKDYYLVIEYQRK